MRRAALGIGSAVLLVASVGVIAARDPYIPPISSPLTNLVPSPIEAPSGPATYADPLRGFAVTYPSGWQVLAENQTPDLCCSPFEILTVATFPGHPGGLCSQYPSSAADELGPTDALISIQERHDSPLSDFPPRPASFGPRDGGSTEWHLCLQRPKPFLPSADRFPRCRADVLHTGRDRQRRVARPARRGVAHPGQLGVRARGALGPTTGESERLTLISGL